MHYVILFCSKVAISLDTWIWWLQLDSLPYIEARDKIAAEFNDSTLEFEIRCSTLEFEIRCMEIGFPPRNFLLNKLKDPSQLLKK